MKNTTQKHIPSVITKLQEYVQFYQIDKTEDRLISEIYNEVNSIYKEFQEKELNSLKPADENAVVTNSFDISNVNGSTGVITNFAKDMSLGFNSNLENIAHTNDKSEAEKNFYSSFPYIVSAYFSRTIRNDLLSSANPQDNSLGRFVCAIKNSKNPRFDVLRNTIKEVALAKDMMKYALNFSISYEMVSRIVGNLYLPTQIYKTTDLNVNPIIFSIKGYESIPINLYDIESNVQSFETVLREVTYDDIKQFVPKTGKKEKLSRLDGYEFVITANVDLYNYAAQQVRTLLETTLHGDIEDAVNESDRYKIALFIGIEFETIVTDSIIRALTNPSANSNGGGLYLSNIDVLQKDIIDTSDQQTHDLLPVFEAGQPDQYAVKTIRYGFGRKVEDKDLLKVYSTSPLTLGNGAGSTHNAAINVIASVTDLQKMLTTYKLGTGKTADILFVPIDVLEYIYDNTKFRENIQAVDAKVPNLSTDSPFYHAITFQGFNESMRKQREFASTYGASNATGGQYINRCPVGQISIEGGSRNLAVIPLLDYGNEQKILRYVERTNTATSAIGLGTTPATANTVTNPFPRFIGTFFNAEFMVASNDLFEQILFNSNPLSLASGSAPIFQPAQMADQKRTFAHGLSFKFGYQTDLAVGKFTSVVANQYIGFNKTNA